MLLVRKKNTSPENLFLQPPPGRLYVRSFLFSRRIDAPFARIHLIARAFLILSLSGLLLRTIDTMHPDPVGAALLLVAALLAFVLSGMQANVARLYLLLTLSPLLSLFTTWVLFNPVPGHTVLLQLHLAFFHSLKVLVSDQGVLVASTKVIGYAGMVFATIALMVTSRDTELIGTLRQLHIPQSIIFFLSTVFRSLDLALSDYNTIRQAQLARAINAQPRNMLRRLRDLASLAVPIIATMIRRSSEIGDALLVRGYTLGQPSADFYETSPWCLIDWGVAVVSIGLLFLAFAPHDTLTHLLGWWT